MRNQDGTTFIELLMYILITAVLLVLISSMVINIFNSRTSLRAHENVQQNARFIFNFVTNRVHNVESIVDISPDPRVLRFYTSSTEEWFTLEHSTAITALYYEEEDLDPVKLNSDNVRAVDFTLTPVLATTTTSTIGVIIDLTLETGTTTNPYSFISNTYSTFLGIR